MEMTQETKERIFGVIEEYLRRKFPHLLDRHHHSHEVLCPVCQKEDRKTVLVKKVDIGASGEEDCPNCNNVMRFVYMSNGQLKAWKVNSLE